MQEQTPAQSVSLQSDYGTLKMYNIMCECGDSDHTHTLSVESNDFGVTVTVYVNTSTEYYSPLALRYDIDNEFLQRFDWVWKTIYNNLITKLKLTAKIWFKGRVDCQEELILSEQGALNYAKALEHAVADVAAFKQQEVDNT